MSKRSASGAVKITRTVSAPMQSSSMRRPKQFGKGRFRAKMPGLRALVSKTIRSLAEKKKVTSNGIAGIDSAVGAAPSTLSLVPRIEQGVAQNERTGNDVRVTKGIVRGHINIETFNATTNPACSPVLVKMWLCRYKTQNTASILQTNADTAFFEGTAGGSIGFGGTIADMGLFPNTDSWTVYETKEFKIGVGSTSSTFPVAAAAYFDNSPACVAFEFDCTKYLQGTTQYLDNDSSVSTNKNLFLVFQAVYAFPYATSEASALAQLTYSIQHEYIDV